MVVRCSNPAAFVVLEAEPVDRTGIQVHIYDGNDPETLVDILPDTFAREWLDELNGPGAGSFKVSARNPRLANPDLLAYGNIARMVLDEVPRFAFTIEHKNWVDVGEGEDADRVLTVSGRGVLAKLEEAQVYLSEGLTGEVERAIGVGATNAGLVMLELLVDNFDRGGVAQHITMGFTFERDSNNAIYEVPLYVGERAGTDLLRVALRHAELAVDVHMTPALVLQYFNTRGVDRTIQTADVGPVVFQPGDNVTELDREENGVIRNVLLIETPEGWTERSDLASIAEHGRKEAYLSLGNVTDSDQINRAAEAVFDRTAQPAAHITVRVTDTVGKRPYVDAGVGDWILAPSDLGELTSYRIRSWTIKDGPGDSVEAIPELSTVTDELEVRMKRWLEAMSRGTVGGVAGQIAEPTKAPGEVTGATGSAGGGAIGEAVGPAIAEHVSEEAHHDELADFPDVATSGDVSGDIPGPLTVIRARGILLPTPGAGDDGQVLTYDHGGGAYELTPGGGGTGLPEWLTHLGERLPGETAHAADDFFGAYSGYTEIAAAGTAVWAAGRRGLTCKFQNVGNAKAAATLKAVPAAGVPITLDTFMVPMFRDDDNNAAGLIFTNGTTSGASIAALGLMSTSGGACHVIMSSGTLTAVTSGVGMAILAANLAPAAYMRLIWSAANTFEFALSPDGETWVDFGFGTFTRTFTPTHMGFWVTNWNSSSFQQAVAFHYLRVGEFDGSV